MTQDGDNVIAATGDGDTALSSSRRAILDRPGLVDLLRLDPGFPFDGVLVDLPRYESPLTEPRSSLRWASRVYRLLRVASDAVAAEGVVIAECDDQSLPVVLQACNELGLYVRDLIAWQKKYSAQQDASRVIHPLHDWLILLGSGDPQGDPALSLLSFTDAGKSEDAAKEFQDEMSDKQWRAPQALKPRRLYRWIRKNHLSGVSSILDLTSCGASLSTVMPEDVRVVDVFQDSGDLGASLALAGKRSDLEYARLLDASHFEGCLEDETDWYVADKGSSTGRGPGVRLDGEASPSGSFTLRADNALEAAHAAGVFVRGSVAAAVVPQECMLVSPDEWLSVLRVGGALFVRVAGGSLIDIVRATDPLSWQGTLICVDEQESGLLLYVVLCRSGEGGLSGNIGTRKSHDYHDAEGDPRGRYRIPTFKDTKSGSPNLDYTTYAPPYEWRHSGGPLPDGFWRVNPQTGVIWGYPSELGRWTIDVEVRDGAGNVASASQVIEVLEPPSQERAMLQLGDLPWVMHGPEQADGPLEVVEGKYEVYLGRETSIALEARGGAPLVREFTTPGQVSGKGRTRYWPCSLRKLERRVRRDLVEWGKKGGRPRRRRYEIEDRRKRGKLTSIQTFDSATEGPFPWKCLAGELSPRLQVVSDEGPVDVNVTSPGEGDLAVFRVLECDGCRSLAPRACSLEHAAQDLGLVAISRDALELPDTIIVSDLFGRQRSIVTALPVTPELEALIASVAPGLPCLGSRAPNLNESGASVGRLSC